MKQQLEYTELSPGRMYSRQLPQFKLIKFLSSLRINKQRDKRTYAYSLRDQWQWMKMYSEITTKTKKKVFFYKFRLNSL